MSDLALDPATGDLRIEGGDLVLIQGPEAIAQDANLRVGLFLGEWPLDLRVGIDYRGLFFDRKPPDAVIRAVYDQVLRETAGVASVDRLRLSFERRTRTLTVNATLKAADGALVPVYRDILLDVEPPQAPKDVATVADASLPGLSPFGTTRTYGEVDR